MRRSLLFAALLGLAAGASAQPQSLVDQFQKRSITSNGLTVGYRLFVPVGYDPAVKYPVVLALHGAGERGTDNETHIRIHRLATSWADPASQADNPAFVVAPQAPPNLRWSSLADPDASGYEPLERAVLDILATVEDEFTIDRDREYVVGLSLGGHGTWDLISRLPGRFAAAVPMSGEAFASQADDIALVPIWAFHGESDGIVPASQSRRVVQAMENLGRQVIYTDCRRSPVAATNFDCPGPISQDSLERAIDARADLIFESRKNVGHGPWNVWFDRPGLHDWLFSFVRQDPNAIAVQAPARGAVWTGPTAVTWTSPRAATETVEVWLSRNDGRDWTLAGSAPLGAGTFTVDSGRDAALARVRLVVLNTDGRVAGRDVSDPFRIDGPGNAAPSLRLDDEALRFSPSVTAPSLTLRLTAADAEGSPLTATVSYSADGGETYAPVTTVALASSPDPQTIPVDVAALPNSSRARLQVSLSDATATTTAETVVFSKTNTRQSTLDVQHVAGNGRGTVRAIVVDPAALTGHRYRVGFIVPVSSSDPPAAAYIVRDLTTGAAVLGVTPFSDGVLESPVFDGLALVVQNGVRGVVAEAGWTGASTLGVAIAGETARISILTLDLLGTEATYTITMTEGVSGRSVERYRIAARDLRFTVTSSGQLISVIFSDLNGNGRPDSGDALYILAPDGKGELQPAWALTFSADASTVLPATGDVFTFVPSPRLRGSDAFEFTAMPVASEDPPSADGVEIVSGFPNPFTDRLTVAYRLAEPASVRLEVLDALGRQVATLVDASMPAGDHAAAWQADAASGVFFVRLTATPAAGGPSRSVQRSVLHVSR